MDNNENNNQKEKKSLYEIMDKRGFYIILFLCIGIIGVTGLWLNNQNKEDYIAENTGDYIEDKQRPEVTLVENTDKEVDRAQETGRIGEGKPKDDGVKDSREEKETKEKREKEEEKRRQDQEKKQEEKHKDQDEKDRSQEDTSKDKRDTKEENSKDKETSGEVSKGEDRAPIEKMAMPVVGKLMLPFAEDRLVYHKTLDHWSTHKGIDLKAEEGAPVKAALAGEVVEIVSDSIMGISIIIKHDEELLSIYSNLGTDAMVKLGEEVKKGQTIGTVGKTASAKALEGPLLHFQVFRDDKFVDPEIYLEPWLNNN